MISSYAVRLLVLCLASFFLIHLAIGSVILLLAPAILRIAQRMPAQSAARLILALRLFPSGLAMALVAGLGVPSFFLYEPVSTPERVGVTCLIAAAFGAMLWMIAIGRTWIAAAQSRRFMHNVRKAGIETRVRDEAASLWIVPETIPGLALAGIFRPRLVISRTVMESLSADELEAALRHERAHWIAGDNPKRLAIFLAPELLPFSHRFQMLENAWAGFAERAADDYAAAGGAQHALALADALVRVARLGITPLAAGLSTSLLSDPQDLRGRVQRLLHKPAVSQRSSRKWSLWIGGALATCLLSLALQPAILKVVHEALEYLIA